jgi:DNA-directed RNA polymerase subunit RPC12/RpoP
MNKEDNNKNIHPMFQDIWRVFHFRCEKCDKSIRYRSLEDVKAKDIICIHCGHDVVKFRDVSTSAFGNISGKVDYISYEKQSAINIKQQGKQVVKDIINNDPYLSARANEKNSLVERW